MEYNNINVIYKNKSALIIINRPECHNALDEETIKEINYALNIIEENHRMRAVIIRGEGDQSFSSGGDLYKIREKTVLEILQSKLQDLCIRIEKYKLPVIAAINGYALGGGFELSLSCDFRIASNNVVLGLPELKLGLIPSAGGIKRLSQLIGIAKTKEIILLGLKIKAEEAKELGLVSDVVESVNLINASEDIVEKIINNSPMAIYLTKLILRNTDGIDTDYEKMCQATLINYKDKTVGFDAFFEKRTPDFEDF